MKILKNLPIPVCVLLVIVIGSLFLLTDHHKNIAHNIWYATLVIGGLPIVIRTIKGMLKGEFATDIVAMLAILTAAWLDQGFAGSIIVLMQSGGEAIERYGFRKASSSLEELLRRAPRKARRISLSTQEIREIKVEEVNIGDHLSVRPGDMIPVDATIIEGSSQIDDSAITGEPFEKEKTVGATLLSGSINISGLLTIRADKKSQESQYAKIVDLVQKAQEEKAPIQRLADKYAIIFTPLTLLMCLLGYVLTREFSTVLSVLVVATPCPLILATPLAVICGVNQAARDGIIVKGGSAMEEIASAQAVLFDKTGTITFGTPNIEKIIPLSTESPEEILLQAASLEQFSSHSLAKAIAHKAKLQQITLIPPKNFMEIAGKGVTGKINEETLIVGSASLIKDLSGIDILQQNHSQFSSYLEKNSILCFVMRNNLCIGAIVLTDHIRPKAKETMQELRNLGIQELMMITGDSEISAKKISKEVGIDHFKANLLPLDKVEIVNSFKKNYKHIVMVGDGINDAPALATANIGIAMGAHGTAISAEAANVVLLVDDITKVANAIKISKRMLHIAKQSIFVGIGLSFLLMVYACFGTVLPAFGAVLQEIVDVAVILNALRVLNGHKSKFK